MSRLSWWLEAGSTWRALEARVRAYMALRLAKSWHYDLDLGMLTARCANTDAELGVI